MNRLLISPVISNERNGVLDFTVNGIDTSTDDINLTVNSSSPTSPHPPHTVINKGNSYFSVPPHTPVIFSEVGGRTLFRFLCRDASGDSERMLLNENVPQWVVSVTVEVDSPLLSIIIIIIHLALLKETRHLIIIHFMNIKLNIGV